MKLTKNGVKYVIDKLISPITDELNRSYDELMTLLVKKNRELIPDDVLEIIYKVNKYYKPIEHIHFTHKGDLYYIPVKDGYILYETDEFIHLNSHEIKLFHEYSNIKSDEFMCKLSLNVFITERSDVEVVQSIFPELNILPEHYHVNIDDENVRIIKEYRNKYKK